MKRVNLTIMGSLHIIHFISVFRQIISILVLESLNGFIELQLVLSLDGEDFIFKFGNMTSQVVLGILMILKLPFITSSQKVDFLILLDKSGIQIVDFFHEGFLDEMGQFSDIGNPVLSLVNQI